MTDDATVPMSTVEELPAPHRPAARRAAIRAFRPRRALPAIVTAVLLTMGGALVAMQVVSVRLGHPALPPALVAHAARFISSQRWDKPAMLAASGAVVLAGALLVLVAALPGRGRTVALSTDDPWFITGITRPGLRAVLCATVLAVPGIAEVRVRLRGRLFPRVVVHAVTQFHNPSNLPDQVSEAVQARIAGIDPVRTPRVVVRLTWRED